jgi:hypothetical protein
MQAQMNIKIKFRERFRPFAPSVLRERVSDWFELDVDSPYMLLVAPVRKERQIPMDAAAGQLWGIEKLNVPRSDIPAVTHIDYSARIQTVSRDTNPDYYDLIHEFECLTGCAVLINTSFNVRGEPIVCSPADAYRCFMRTHIDHLVLGPFLLDKEGNRMEGERRLAAGTPARLSSAEGGSSASWSAGVLVLGLVLGGGATHRGGGGGRPRRRARPRGLVLPSAGARAPRLMGLAHLISRVTNPVFMGWCSSWCSRRRASRPAVRPPPSPGPRRPPATGTAARRGKRAVTWITNSEAEPYGSVRYRARALALHEGSQEVVAAPDHSHPGAGGWAPGLRPGIGAGALHLHHLLAAAAAF